MVAEDGGEYMLMAVYVVFAVAVLFGLTIFAHEFAHFLVARRLGLAIEVFSIGFGPAIWKRKRRGITYKIGIIPFGGYVALPQLDPSGMALVQGTPGSAGPEAPPSPLPPVSPSSRILVSLAGPFGNLVFAVLLAWILYLATQPGVRSPSGGVMLGYVETNSLAYAQGLCAGDEVLAVNRETVNTWLQFVQLASLSKEPEIRVKTREGTRTMRLRNTKDTFGIRMIDGIEKSSVCRVVFVESGSGAHAAGVQSGDVIVDFDGVRVGCREHLIEMVSARVDQTVPMTVQRGRKTVAMEVTPRFDPERRRARIGIRFDSLGVELDELAQMPPWYQIKCDATAIIRVLRALLTPREAAQAAESIGGPPMILVTIWFVVKVSLLNALGFLRFLNVNLAIVNLLPIPVLDGGSILFSVWEAATRRRIHPRVVSSLVNAFAVLLIGLLVFLSGRDIQRFWRIHRTLKAESAKARPAVVAPTGEVGGAAAESAR